MSGAVEDEQQMKGAARLVLVTPSFQGHVTPMLQLADLLHQRGFSITIICTGFIPLTPTHSPSFTVLQISTGLSQEEVARLDAVTHLYVQNTNCVEPFTDCLGRIIRDAPKEERVLCLISDELLRFPRAVADSFKLRLIVLRTSGASSLIALDEWCRLRASGLLPSDASVSDKAVRDLPPLRFKDLPTFNFPELPKLYGILDDAMREVRLSSGLICNTFEELEDPALALVRRRMGIPCFAIGPFHKLSPKMNAPMQEEDASVIPWLDSQQPRSVVYVSFGSIAAIAETEFVEMAWGLVNSGHPFLFVVRSGLIPGSGWPDGMPVDFAHGRGKIVNWAPQKEVLAHEAVAAFCTHAGWNSTIESITEGVPMICLPSFGDQKSNARHVEEVWKIGVYVENGLRREEIERAITRVMGKIEGQEIRGRLQQLKEKARLSLQPGGSTLLSFDKFINYIMSF